jgi:hypothetical protein
MVSIFETLPCSVCLKFAAHSESVAAISNPADSVLTGVGARHPTVYTRRTFAEFGIQDASFHSLRRTAASWLVIQGVDLYAVG